MNIRTMFIKLQWNKIIYEIQDYNLATMLSFWYIKRKYSYLCNSAFNETNIHINLENSCNSRRKQLVNFFEVIKFFNLELNTTKFTASNIISQQISPSYEKLPHVWLLKENEIDYNFLYNSNSFLVETLIHRWIYCISIFGLFISIFLERMSIAICVGCILIKQNIKPHSLLHL